MRSQKIFPAGHAQSPNEKLLAFFYLVHIALQIVEEFQVGSKLQAGLKNPKKINVDRYVRYHRVRPTKSRRFGVLEL